MRLKNKKTGEIAEASILNFELVVRYDDGRVEKYPLLFDYSNFEYHEEPKNNRTWFLDFSCVPDFVSYGDNPITDPCYDDWNELGICFETEEEAMRAVEKLKAWKRLKDNGFKIKGWKFTPDMKQIYGNYVKIKAEIPQIVINEKDLDICFGGEE